MATDPKLEQLEQFQVIDVHARARDTSIWENCSNCSKLPTTRWPLMLAALLGKPMQPLPATPGRRCMPLGPMRVTDDDPLAAAWDAQHQPCKPPERATSAERVPVDTDGAARALEAPLGAETSTGTARRKPPGFPFAE